MVTFSPALPDTANTGDAGHVSDHNAIVAAINTLNTALEGRIKVGTGSPQNTVTASPGVLYLNLSGGANTTLWVKESGTNTNTGWVAK